MAQYFSILTEYGTQAFAKALANNQPLKLAQFAVGDGNGQAVTPTANRTALARETYRANVSAVSLDPRNNKQVIVELTIPENIGGFYIREMGVFDNQNKLIAYANSPESYKPTEDSGSGKVQVLRMILKIASSNAVTLSIDNSVIFVTRQQLAPKTITATTKNGFDETGHSHEIERASISQAGIVQLTDDTGLDSDKLGLTARAGKKLAQWIANLQLALNNYIPNSKKSSRVDSNSADDVATSAAVKAANDNANSRVPKVGDTEITGRHFFKNNNSWIGVISTGSATAGYDATVKDGKFPQVTYSASEVGNHGVEARIFVTPEGPNYEIDRRRHVLTVGITGEMWSAAYGKLHDYFHHDGKSYVTIKQEGGFAGLHINRQNGKRARVELIDDKFWKFWLEDGYDIFMPAKGGTVALLDDVDLAKQAAAAANQAALNAHQAAINANDNANNRVSRAGDVMTGDLTVPHLFVVRPHSWLDVKSTESNGAGLDMTVSNAGAAQAAVEAVDVGNHTVEMRFHVMPPGYDFNITRRQVGMTLSGNGHIWAKPYGWLHDYFHHDSKSYVTVKQDGGLAGLHINRSNGKRARIELINDAKWKFWLEDKYDIFMPEKGGIVALLDDVKTVTRKDYSRTIKGTRPDWDDATSKNISVTGYVCIYPDGRIEQFFYFRNFRVNWFDFEPIRDSHFRQVEIPIQLWTAMPNKVTWVEAHISRTNDTNIWSPRTVGAEAGEWTKPIWGFEKQGSIKDRTNIYTRRINGDTGETVDMMIKVEGY